MRIDGHSVREIQEATGIHSADLYRRFAEYKNEAIAELKAELFEMQTQRLMALWQAAISDVRKFVPVVSADGKLVTIPLLNEHGEPVLGPDGQVLTEILRDHAVHLAAVNVAAKITERIAKHYGLDAPEKKLMLNEGGEREITFRIVDAKDGQLVQLEALTAPVPADAANVPEADVPTELGAEHVVTSVVGGVEVVSISFSVPEPQIEHMG